MCVLSSNCNHVFVRLRTSVGGCIPVCIVVIVTLDLLAVDVVVYRLGA